MGQKNVILIKGKPFSGKTEISEFLEREFGFMPISTKKVLIEYDPSLKENFDQGIIPGDEVVIPAFEQCLPITFPCVIDTPRSGPQVSWFRQNFYRADVRLLNLLLSDDNAHQRMCNAAKTARGGRADDNQLSKRLADYERYSLEVEVAARSQGIRIYNVDANMRREDVQNRVKRFCFELGIRSRETSAV